MREGMQSLLQLLRGGDVDSAMEDAEWEAMLRLAEEEHLLPWGVTHARPRSISFARRRETARRRGTGCCDCGVLLVLGVEGIASRV
jgi:hypothetical protein